jgi:hypothetical protein
VCFHSDIIVVIYYNFNNILFINNSIYNAKAKHIEVHYHFVKEKVLTRDIGLFMLIPRIKLLTFSQRL